MHKNLKKKWTILIYADGNNEMEGIMYKSLLSCKKIISNEDVNVVFEIGRLDNYKSRNSDDWCGVRRYHVDKGNLILVEDLGKSNMADPNNLYSFIKWGFENYKSEHYMVVLSDHGGDFIGCFTDLSKNKPYIMGIPEMIEAINAVRKNLGYEIDILVLDMCYMNSIEVIYELGQEKYNTAKTVITYMDYASYDGLNYEKLISCTEKNSNVKNLRLFIKLLIDSLEFDFQAFEINNKRL
ncbi:clostripain-related cysteine peptidase [Clostridium rhizosphaerae]|uniref:clostripain-related cysteine peptidase n=1 Tax=Clostridium rhizosphaerae TaxID=2803861 RepID=UPI001FAFD0BC|nr:clostripain-related cysteine peptidase [Clostridium rhizosphaerae]